MWCNGKLIDPYSIHASRFVLTFYQVNDKTLNRNLDSEIALLCRNYMWTSFAVVDIYSGWFEDDYQFSFSAFTWLCGTPCSPIWLYSFDTALTFFFFSQRKLTGAPETVFCGKLNFMNLVSMFLLVFIICYTLLFCLFLGQVVLLCSCILAFFLNYSIFLNTTLNSALTQTICGNLKVCLPAAICTFLFPLRQGFE